MFGEWMANNTPPWEAIWSLLIGRLLGMNKFPGVRPLGCGKAWQKLLAKCVLAVTMTEAELECGIDQLCGGLRAGIEGGVHAMRTIWESMKEEEEIGFLLIDARNAFNKDNQTNMLWTVRHICPTGARFTFNCYQHHSMLYLKLADGQEFEIIHSWEGVTQGNPLAMIAYGISLLPMIRILRKEFPDVFQP